MSEVFKSGAHVKTLRELSGLTVKELAERAGVTEDMWLKWENPKNSYQMKPDVEEFFTNLLDQYDGQVSAFEDVLDEIAGRPEQPETITLTRYRNQAAFHRAHPDFPGGIRAHNQMLALVLWEAHRSDMDVTVVWDDDPNSHIAYE
ncbi:helix-turn-helix domain-containing protein [Acaricomes phytoseiuli]|uniref:helix-turn-helix domain-containing protein n=1 Tax=Acaricomes phytoseiuli TaxID=291968 RepID=UPI0003814C7D|nr:helix-turn-helix domain-containing protein [Acaricomes phytoseiuli]